MNVGPQQIPMIDELLLEQEWIAAMHEYVQSIRTIAMTGFIGRKRPEYPPLAEETIRRKGHDRPLLETARLRNSIEGRVELGFANGRAQIYGVIGTNVEYARVQELGNLDENGFIPPRPFLEPAIEQRRRSFEKRIGEAPSKAIRYR